MSGCGCEVEIKDQSQRQVLYWLLGINATMFVIEMGIGLLADSTALIADSLDMLADAVVYGVALYAIGKSLLHKANAARISGFFQMALGLLIIIDIVRRSIYGSEPVSGFRATAYFYPKISSALNSSAQPAILSLLLMLAFLGC
ncbi:hypothetical protein ACFOEW_15500, partial [Alteromonas oceani]